MLDWALHFIIIFIFNQGSVDIMVSFLSLFCDLMYLCVWLVNLLLLAPDDDPLTIETCSTFFIFLSIHIFKRWCVRRSYCPLPSALVLGDNHNAVQCLRGSSEYILFSSIYFSTWQTTMHTYFIAYFEKIKVGLSNNQSAACVSVCYVPH
jgi:hypothetical protein